MLDGRWERIAVALLGTVAREMDEQIAVGREFGRARILRQEVALLEIELAQLGDAGGLGQRVLLLTEQLAHLGLGFDVALLPEKAKPLWIIEVFAGADRQQHVVRLGVIPFQVVRVVRRGDREAQLRREPAHPCGNDFLFGQPMVLHFQPEAVRPERAREPLGARFRGLVVPLP